MAMRVLHYIRVSDEERKEAQRSSGRGQGYSISDQRRRLAADSASRGEEVVREIVDDGYSGATPDRPGWREVLEVVEADPTVGAVKAVRRDRFFRSRLYRLLADEDLAEVGVKLVALNDTGHRIADGVQDDYSEYEREQITQRTLSGKRQKAREGKVVAGRLPVYGFRFTADRDHYEVDEAAMVAVRRLFALAASGTSVHGIGKALEGEGFPSPNGSKRWQRNTVREAVFDDAYKPHDRGDVAALVSEGRLTAEVASRLDGHILYGVWWYNRRRTSKTRNGKRVKPKPREEWIAVPIPDSGVPREHVEASRRNLSGNAKKISAGRREWDLGRGVIRCGECGRGLVSHTSTWKRKKKDGAESVNRRFYYRCSTYRSRGRRSPGNPGGCSMSWNLHAPKYEPMVWEAVERAMTRPEELEAALMKKAKGRGGFAGSAWGTPSEAHARISKAADDLAKRRDGLIDLAADGVIGKPELSEKLAPLDARLAALRAEASALARRAEEAAREERDWRMLLRALKRGAPEVLKRASKSPEHRAELYRRVNLSVVANADRSLTITWFANELIGELQCQADATSTR